MLLLKKTLACNFTKFNTPQWVFSRFFTCTNGAIQMVQIVQMTEKIQNFNIMQKNWKYLLNRSRENDEKKKVFLSTNLVLFVPILAYKNFQQKSASSSFDYS